MKKLLYLLSKKLEIVWCINELNNYCNISFTISMEMKRDKNHCLQTNYTVKKCASLLVELNNFRPRKIWERRGSGKWSRTVCKCANDDWSATFDRNACTIIGAVGNWMRGVNRPIDEWNMIPPLPIEIWEKDKVDRFANVYRFPARLSPLEGWFFDTVMMTIRLNFLK